MTALPPLAELTEAGLKRLTYEMSTELLKRRSHCYEVVARAYGFRSYAAMRAAWTPPDRTEKGRK